VQRRRQTAVRCGCKPESDFYIYLYITCKAATVPLLKLNKVRQPSGWELPSANVVVMTGMNFVRKNTHLLTQMEYKFQLILIRDK